MLVETKITLENSVCGVLDALDVLEAFEDRVEQHRIDASISLSVKYLHQYLPLIRTRRRMAASWQSEEKDSS